MCAQARAVVRHIAVQEVAAHSSSGVRVWRESMHCVRVCVEQESVQIGRRVTIRVACSNKMFGLDRLTAS